MSIRTLFVSFCLFVCLFVSYLKKIIIIFKQSTGAVSYLNWKQVQISNIHTFQIIVCFFRKMRFHLLHPQAHNEQTDKYAPEQGERKKKNSTTICIPSIFCKSTFSSTKAQRKLRFKVIK